MKSAKKTNNLGELEQTILEACFMNGKALQKKSFFIEEIDWKKIDDPVTNLDKKTEREIISHISKKFDANFVGEEYGSNQKNADITIYIDPIDGTKSFVKGEFLSSVSVAAAYKGELMFGAVYDFMRDIMYYANHEGAYLTREHWSSEQAIALPRHIPKFSQLSVIYTDEGRYIPRLSDLSKRTQTGSVALAMAQVAAGIHQGLIAKPYDKGSENNTCDIAAGYFIMKKAGLVIRDYFLNEYDYKKPGNGTLAGTTEFMSSLEKIKLKNA